MRRNSPGARASLLVALTGWGQEEDKRRSLEAGFNFHMVKPVDPAALEKLLAGLPADRHSMITSGPWRRRRSLPAASLRVIMSVRLPATFGFVGMSAVARSRSCFQSVITSLPEEERP